MFNILWSNTLMVSSGHILFATAIVLCYMSDEENPFYCQLIPTDILTLPFIGIPTFSLWNRGKTCVHLLLIELNGLSTECFFALKSHPFVNKVEEYKRLRNNLIDIFRSNILLTFFLFDFWYEKYLIKCKSRRRLNNSWHQISEKIFH